MITSFKFADWDLERSTIYDPLHAVFLLILESAQAQGQRRSPLCQIQRSMVSYLLPPLCSLPFASEKQAHLVVIERVLKTCSAVNIRMAMQR